MKTEYEHNLQAFKNLIDQYTIGDLESMIYKVPSGPSGACCYPAVQTLVSLMEMLGKLLRNLEGEEAIKAVLDEIGGEYASEQLANILYDLFRNGIAHNSLAKGGTAVKKGGDKSFHLSNNNYNIDVQILYEDFKPVYEKLFVGKFIDEKYVSFYETNLRKIIKELRTEWLDHSTSSFISETLPPTAITTISGMKTPTSGASGINGPINFDN